MFSFTVWIFYGASMLALIVLRYKEPKLPRPYKVMNLINQSMKSTKYA